MKKRLLSLCIILCFFGIKQEVQAQIKITDFPTYVGNPTGGWVPIVINGINRKMNADLIGYNQLDSLSIGLGTSVDTFYLWKHGSIAFYKTYTHNSGGGGSGISSLSLVMPGGFTVNPGTLSDPGTFTVSTNLNGVIHSSGGAFSGGQIIDADVHDITFGKLTSTPTTKAGYNLTDVMTYSDTSSLSNRINLKVKYIDTASMLSVYLRKVDTVALSNRINGKLNVSDTINMLFGYLRKSDTSLLNVSSKLNKSDTANMLAVYLRKLDTVSLSNRINLKINTSDTLSMLSVYLRKVDTISLNNRIALKVGYTDTSSMLNPYLRKIDTTNMLSVYLRKLDTVSLNNRINLKVNISDTSAMLSKYLRKSDTASMLSPYLKSTLASTLYYPLSSNPTGYYKSTDTSLTLATQFYVSQHGSIYTAGYGMGLNAGAFFVDTSANKIATQNYVLTHAGTLYSAGNGLILTGTQFKADTSILATQYDNGLKLNKTDTGNMLTPYIKTVTANANYYPRSLNPANYLSSVDTGNIPSFSVKVRNLFSAGTGLTYNSATGIITNSITNNNQLTNGSGFITGINSSMVITALGYTPINPNGITSQYFRGDGSLSTFSFNNLNDVTVTSPSNNQLMKYNSSTSKWNNFTPTFYQPTDTLTTLATKTNIVKDTVIGFQVGDGGTLTPSNGTTIYSNPLLQFTQLVNVFKGDTVLPTFAITGGKPYVSFNNTTGVLTLHNTTFINGQAVSIQYAFGNGAVSGGGGGGGGDVTSVFGRTGAVIAQAADYSSFYYAIPTGATSQYIRADGSFATFPTLSTVATTGSYTDLTSKPVIPNNTNQLTNGSGFISGITGSMVTTALGYTPLNPSGSSTQYIKGDGTFGTTDTSMIPSFYTKVRSEFSAGNGINILNGVITNNVSSSLILSALGYTPANQSTTLTVNGTTFDLSANRSYNVNYSALADVNLTSLSDGQLTKYNSGTGKWINFTPTYLSTVDTTNISNFYIKVRSLFSAGTGISLSNGVITNTINNTNQLTNGAGFLSTVDTTNISNFYVKVRSLFSSVGGGLAYSNGIFSTDTTGTLATKTNLNLKLNKTDTTSMLSVYLRSALATTLYYPLSSNPTGYYKPTDTTSTLATQYDLNSTIDTIHVIPYTTTGITLLRFTNDSLRPKPLIAGTNITLTQNNDSTVTISSTGGGSTNLNVGSGYRVAVSGTNNVKTLFGTSNQIVIDSATNTNALTLSLPTTLSITNLTTSGTNTFNGLTYAGSGINGKTDVVIQDTTTGILYRKSAQFVDTTGKVDGYVVTWNASAGNFIVSAPTGGGGSGTTNSNIGTGYRLAIPNSNNVKTLFGSNILFDSTSNTNGITLKADTSTSITGLTSLYKDGLKVKYTDTASMLSTYANLGRKNTFSVKQTFTDTLVASSKINFSGLAFAAPNTGKVDVLTQDTTTGYITRSPAQFVDTTGAINGSTVIWNSSANNFILKDPGALTSRTTVADVAYTILTTDYLIAYTSLTTGRTTTLPTAVGHTGKIYIIKDESGNAGTSNITIATTSAQTIDGGSTKTVNTAYGNIKVYSNGANWFTY